jgi:serine/threonine-protein kinase
VSLEKIAEYTLTRELGQGGMGKVYLATSPEGTEVALKTMLLPEGLDARARWETVERFQREARAARSLTHPKICQVLDIGADAETFFIVMELLDGQSLRDMITVSGRIEVQRAMQILVDVCEALAYAHDQGIVHRDIKPDNIMVMKSGETKLMDFGLASIMHETGVTQTGTTMGTFSYMSPEQARGEKPDARSDIFSLGATFYEMLTGEQAFQGDAPGAILSEILNKDPEPVTGVPPQASRAVAKCLRKKPAYRFQNVREIIESLRSAGATTAGQQTMVQGAMVEGTVVMPSTSRAQGPASSPPAVPSSGVGRPRPAASAGSAASRERPLTSGARAFDFRCPKCNEGLKKNTPACWRCGTPNPAMAQRKARSESQSAIMDALKDYKPPKKRGWFRRRR